jgi:hypothetical protein
MFNNSLKKVLLRNEAVNSLKVSKIHSGCVLPHERFEGREKPGGRFIVIMRLKTILTRGSLKGGFRERAVLHGKGEESGGERRRAGESGRERGGRRTGERSEVVLDVHARPNTSTGPVKQTAWRRHHQLAVEGQSDPSLDVADTARPIQALTPLLLSVPEFIVYYSHFKRSSVSKILPNRVLFLVAFSGPVPRAEAPLSFSFCLSFFLSFFLLSFI